MKKLLKFVYFGRDLVNAISESLVWPAPSGPVLTARARLQKNAIWTRPFKNKPGNFFFSYFGQFQTNELRSGKGPLKNVVAKQVQWKGKEIGRKKRSQFHFENWATFYTNNSAGIVSFWANQQADTAKIFPIVLLLCSGNLACKRIDDVLLSFFANFYPPMNFKCLFQNNKIPLKSLSNMLII